MAVDVILMHTLVFAFVSNAAWSSTKSQRLFHSDTILIAFFFLSLFLAELVGYT